MAIVAEDVETALKVIVVGNGGVGKTSMIARFCKGVFTENYKKTIGVDFLERDHYVKALGEHVRMMVWDTAGQEEFDTLTRQYYRGAGACVLVFSTVDRASFDAITGWRDKVLAEVGEAVQMVLVQNKTDLIEHAAVTPAEAEELASKLQLRFYRACVKENAMVTDVFEYLAEAHAKAGAQHRKHAAAAAAGGEGGGGAQQIGSLGGAGAGANAQQQQQPAAGAHRADAAAADRGGGAAGGATSSANGTGSKAFRIDRGAIRRTGGKKGVKCSIV